MENRKLGLLILGVFMTAGLFFTSTACAYWADTHAYLTNESINLYNKTASSNAIPTDLKQYLFDGSKAEDSDPRYVNHFYDPINDQGLDDVFRGESSKLWANDKAAQQDIKYTLQPKLGLSSVAYAKIEKFYPTSDFTWDTALKYWINGDKEMAMETLGHVLHLVEDLGVPEHVRNDSHADGSKYEIYVNKYSLANPDKNFVFRLGDKKQIDMGSLDAYLDSLARYTNKYFYSKDSVGLSGGYESPEPDYTTAEIKNDRKYYIKNIDDEGQQYYLASYDSIANIMTPYDWDVSLNRTLINDSYWNLLSVRTVRTGAGVIDLFFRDVEKAKTDPNFLKEEKKNDGFLNTISAIPGQLWNGTKSVAAGVGSFFGSVFNSIGSGIASAGNFIGGLFVNDNGLTDAGSVDLNASGSEVDGSTGDAVSKTSTTASKKAASTKQADEIAALKMQIEGLKKDAQAQDKIVAQLEKAKVLDPEVVVEKIIEKKDVSDDTQVKVSAAATPVCAYSSGSNVGQRSLIINEIAWMGGVRSASDEWIELKNVSGSDIDVSAWQLLNKGGGIKIHLSGLKNPIIKAGQFILFERTDNNSAVGATADLIYSGALANSSDGLKLFNASCGMVDEVPVATKWSAGNNDTKQTMERDHGSYGWHTSTSSGGTPKKENSAGVSYGGGGSANTLTNSSASSLQDLGRGGDAITPQIYPTLLISEVQLASASSTHDEFVTLYNPNDVAVALTDWYVQKKTKTAADFSTFAKADLLSGKYIPSHGFFTITHPSSTVAHDVVSDYGISDDNTLVIKNPNGDIADKVGWGAAGDCEGSCAANPADGQSIRRKYVGGSIVDTNNNAQDFELSALQTPIVLTDNATTTQPSPEAMAGEAESSTSTVYWDGGAQTGTVYELPINGWIGQRVHFSSSVDIGRISFGYYNDHGPGSVDIAIFESNGAQRWTTSLTVLRINTGGYVSHEFPEALHLAAGDYFVGSRLVTGNIGIRKAYGNNSCGDSIYTAGNIPACVDGDDVSMRIGRWGTNSTSTPTGDAGNATSTTTTSTEEIPDSFGNTQDGQARDGADVVINEIMYDLVNADDGHEWVELYNNGTTSVDIADWRLHENDTNHLLDIKQGASTLPAGGYAVIASDSAKFLLDNNGFSGVLFDSAFSLSNEGEAIMLKNGDMVIDTTTYASSTGANGDGRSLQKFSDGWRAAPSTPGSVNVLPVVVVEQSTSTATTTPTETATSTATTTPQLPALIQSISDNRSNSERVARYVQGIGMNSIDAIKSFKVYVESDELVPWDGGICKIPAGDHSKCFDNIVITARSGDVPDVNSKTLLSFDFTAPQVLDTQTEYALYLKPVAGMTWPHSSVYGSSNDVYSGGSLWDLAKYDGYSPGTPGIKDMYFEVR